MKFLSYNIMAGGYSSYNPQEHTPERLPLIKEALKSLEADFVVLLDTYGWIERFSEKELEETFGYTHSFMTRLDDPDPRHDPRNAMTVLTNLEHVGFESVRLFNRNCIRATIGEDLDVFCVHWDDMKEDNRVTSVQELLKHVSNQPTIVMGDFNAMDSVDLRSMEEEEARFRVENPEITRAFESIVDDMKRCATTNLLKEQGFRSAFSDFQPTMPTKLLKAIVHKPFMKVDHVFYRGEVSITETQTHTGSLFDTVSDHYPISFQLI